MIPFQERKKIRRIMYSKVSLLVLFVILLIVGKGAWNVYKKAEIARSERDIALRYITQLETRNADMQSSLEHFKNNSGIEEEVRQKYTVARPGEEIVVVVDDDVKKGKNSEVVDKKSLWQHIIDFFIE
ncbi:MAG: hypothetical protein WBC83_01260 [Minisyncoccia bacterium]